MRDDPRITRVGRLLRRSSLDELPQLLNVLHGEMSLVARERSSSTRVTASAAGVGRGLHVLKPGMTGPWKILGSGRVTLYEMVKIDYLYVANWSMWKLLVRTVAFVVARRGM